MNLAKLSVTGERIRDMQLDQQAEKIVASLLAFSIDIGMKTLHESMQQSLVVFIIEYFGHLSVDQLTLAFDMAVAGKLDAETKVFGSEINKQFVGHILGKFDKYRKANLQYAQNPKQPALPEGIETKNKLARENYFKQMAEIKANEDWDKVNGRHYQLINQYKHQFTVKEKKAAINQMRPFVKASFLNENMRGKLGKFELKAALQNIESTDKLKHAAMIHLATEWLKNNEI